MYRFTLTVLTILFISSLRVVGQIDSSSIGIFSGTIIDDSLEFAIPSVHLWNESARMGSISSDSGEFSIKARGQDTVVFSAIGYYSQVVFVSSSLNQRVVLRLKPKKYEIGEVVFRRFRSYESFKYQVIHLELPESKISVLKEHIEVTSIAAAIEADRERAIKLKLDGFGYTTPPGPGINPLKAFKEKTLKLEKRQRVINAKFNRELVGDITHLNGEELSEFIALCNFSEEYLYAADLPTIIEDLYTKLDDYQNLMDTIPSESQ